jgi:PAS domain S-box-containing protein
MKKILVVDNDQFMLKFISDVISQEGFEVITAEDGLSALDILENYTPDIIFIDLVMPNINGKKLCKIIRGMEELEHSYIVILSAVAAEEEVDFAELGAHACIAKGPLEEMAQNIRAVIEQYNRMPSQCLPEAPMGIKNLHRRGITEELLSVKRHFEIILEKMSEGILEITSKGRIVYANPIALILTGIAEKELLGSYFIKLFDENDHHRINELLKTIDDKPVTIADDSPVNLNEHQVILSILPIHEQLSTTIVIMNEVTERKRSEKTLKETNKFLRNILDSSSSISIMSTDLDQNILFWNKGAENIFGYKSEEIVGIKKSDILYPGEEEKALVEDIRLLIRQNKKAITCEIREVAKDGRKLWINLNLTPRFDEKGNVIGILGIGEDITERKRLEDQLGQDEKMKAIGTLAGGIAHDFNNILAAIIGYTEIAALQIPEESKAKESLKEVLNAGRRARDLVKQILAFSRKGEQERIPMQIGPVVKEALRLLRSSLPTTIEIRQNIESETGIVEADPTQIHQILMNLCANASQAMGEEGGILEVAIENVELGGLDSESGHFDIPPGNYLRLTVSDTGQGMPPKVLERIFEPYYTTKERGEGTGLGLSVVHGIVKNYGGTVTAYSEPGKGSTFHVYFPVIEQKREVLETDESGPIPTGNESILFIDDEPPLVDLGKQMLGRLGYKVSTRTSSLEALELFKVKPDQFDLVITDMTMPNMTGEKLARNLMKIRSDILVIICTGYSEFISEEKANKIGIRAFIMKPLVMRDLANTVRKVLDNK